jgi:hypothetical protein
VGLLTQKSLDLLTPYQRVVYDIVPEHGPVGPSEIHERYSEDVDDPWTKRTVRAYLSKITQYNLLEADGSSRDREYTAIDQPSPTLAEQGNLEPDCSGVVERESAPPYFISDKAIIVCYERKRPAPAI